MKSMYDIILSEKILQFSHLLAGVLLTTIAIMLFIYQKKFVNKEEKWLFVGTGFLLIAIGKFFMFLGMYIQGILFSLLGACIIAVVMRDIYKSVKV